MSFVALLWLTLSCILGVVIADVHAALLAVVLAFLGFGVCGLNTVSMLATMRHLREQREQLYGQELYWLSQARVNAASAARESEKLKGYHFRAKRNSI